MEPTQPTQPSPAPLDAAEARAPPAAAAGEGHAAASAIAAPEQLDDDAARAVVERYLNKQQQEGHQNAAVETAAVENAAVVAPVGGGKGGGGGAVETGKVDGEGPNASLPDKPTCSCRKSRCILLYCPCFGAGEGCRDDCKCKVCKNPKGINPLRKWEEEMEAQKRRKKKRKRHHEKASKAPPTYEQTMASQKLEVPSLLMLTVSPGRLGLTLAMVPDGGARVTAIDPACTFRGQIEVGDRIVTIDGRTVEKLSDLAVGKERVRKFGIVKAGDVATETVGGEDEEASGGGEPPPQKPVEPLDRPKYNPFHNQRRQTFPYLKELNAIGTDREAEHRREDIMTELLQWDKRNNINTTAKMGPSRYQLIAVPLKRRETVNKRELDNQCFHQYNKQTKLFDKFLGAWSSYCDGTEEDAANMILYYMAKRFPQCYVKNFDMATKKNDKIEGKAGPPPVELPPDFVSYDGTNDVKWNTRYAELVKYQAENGDVKVFSKTDLGKWVCSQRSARKSNAKSLTPKRIELLDKLGMAWSGLPEGWARPLPGGNPRLNRAIAAKFVYPELTIREVLRLGGFSEDELNAVKDQKHTWRTGYVFYKDQIFKKMDNYETARRTGARLEIEKLVNILRSATDEDRVQKVFGEHADLLPGFMEQVEVRREHGIVERRRRSKASRKKQAEDEGNVAMDDAMSDEDTQRHAAPNPAPLEAEHPTAAVDPMDFQAQPAYDHNIGGHDHHSWREQGNYWR